jgi:hypothetical protein
MTAHRYAVAAALLLDGCGASARDAVELAARRWQRATGVPCTMPAFVIGREGAFPCGEAVPSAAGCYRRTEDVIEINMRSDRVAQIALHEYGHRLGAPHGPNGTLLAPELGSAARCITREDLDVVCALNDCQWEKPECL